MMDKVKPQQLGWGIHLSPSGNTLKITISVSKGKNDENQSYSISIPVDHTYSVDRLALCQALSALTNSISNG